MADPATAPPAAVAETHVSVVFFVGDRAYKLKKPVTFGFLDFSTREARLAACTREVELNRRFAPDVYLGVMDVLGPDGDVADHLVAMRRMPPARRLAALVAGGADVDACIGEVARLVATFHVQAPRGPEISAAGTAEAVLAKWERNFVEAERAPATLLEPAALDEARRLVATYVRGRAALFDQRIAAGWVRDGHGDLLADDVFCLDDGPRVLDCLEFDDHLRHGDVLADVAFLAMDLERLGAAGAAGLLLEEWRRALGETHPISLQHHYVASRALIRTKVAALRAAQRGEATSRDAAALLELTLHHLRAGEVRLVLVGGGPGTGKSTLATGLGAALGWRLISSDVTRKEIHGLDPTAPAPAALGEGLYSAEATDRTYAAMLERASAALALGESVVLDATWGDQARRRAVAAGAVAADARLVELRCVAPAPLAASRILRRREGPTTSDATPAIAAELAAAEAPWPSATAIDTSGSAADALAAALVAVGERPFDPCPI